MSFLLFALMTMSLPDPNPPFYRSALLFPPESLHNHSSCIVETPKGNLLACWYRGSGERRADDVAVMGARLRKGGEQWSSPFVMADTPGFPDTNPCLFIDANQRLWLFWCTILENRWETALGKIKTSRDYDRGSGAPRWETETVMHLKPGAEFQETFARDFEPAWKDYLQLGSAEERAKNQAEYALLQKYATEKLSVRLGWMMRVHPFQVNPNRWLVPLYSDAFNFSLMAITDDGGATWKCSAPIIGAGNVQPSVAARKDGTLVAYFRDNGPPPQRVMVSESKDGGMTWSRARDTELPDPGASVEAIALQSGRWIIAHNRTESGRHQLAIGISEDEGRTWRKAKFIERDAPGQDAGSYSYPSLLQAKDGVIHLTYSYRPNAKNALKEGKGESVKHVQFNEAWLLDGAE